MPENAELEGLRADFEAMRHILSHTFRDPLRSALMECDPLLHQESPHPSLQHAMDSIRHVIEGIDTLKAYAFLEITPSDEAVDLYLLAQKAVASLQEDMKAVHATVDIGPLPALRVDVGRMEQVFLALLENALTFRSPERPPVITLSASEANQVWTFCLQDNGVGIDPLYRRLVFAPFQRLNPEDLQGGVGIGLAFARKIIALHGGKIWFESDGELGTCFYFTLPSSISYNIQGPIE